MRGGTKADEHLARYGNQLVALGSDEAACQRAKPDGSAFWDLACPPPVHGDGGRFAAGQAVTISRWPRPAVRDGPRRAGARRWFRRARSPWPPTAGQARGPPFRW